MNSDGRLDVKVHRKSTHTNKYLNYDSRSSTQSKRAVVKKLLNRAVVLPSSDEFRNEEKNKVLSDLKVNGYPVNLSKLHRGDEEIYRNDRPLTSPKGFAVIPYVYQREFNVSFVKLT